MPRHRFDIDEKKQKKILEELNKGASIHSTGLKWGLSDSTISRIKKGQRDPKTGKPPGDLCHCCGFRPVDRAGGLTRLCRWCFENANNGAIDCHSINLRH